MRQEITKVIDKGKYVINLQRPPNKPTIKEWNDLHNLIANMMINKYNRQQKILRVNT